MNGLHMTTIGYARASSQTQSVDIQVNLLKAAGCEIVRAEKVSGKSRNGRDELATILSFVRAGDQVVVAKLDRLGRSTRDVLNLVHELKEKGASLRILEPAIDTGGPLGVMVLTILGMVAEMELSHIKDRQRIGIEAAKLAGVYKGRPTTLDRAKIIEMRESGVGPTAIAKALKCSRGAIYKILGEASNLAA